MQKKSVPIYILAMAVLFLGIGVTSARNIHPASDDITTGAQLYDKWFAALKTNAPEGNMPLWSSQSANTRSGSETWRCAECHGWDYKGKDGAYGAGSHYTSFPGVFNSTTEVVAVLKGSTDPGHDFSAYLDDASLENLAVFIKEGLIDDSEYIDTVTLKTKGGDAAHGQQLFETTCAACHGAEGEKIIFRTEGINESLGAVANRDPYRFLHRTRFGVAGTEMPVGYALGWKPKDGVDLLAYAQTLPTGLETEPQSNAGQGSEPSPQVGGPLPGVGGGILTGFLAFFGVFGVSLFFLFGFVVLAILVVWALRKRK